MKKFNIYLLFFVTSCLISIHPANAQTMKTKKAVPIIFDADFGPMTKSTKAMAVFHALDVRGEAKLLATISDHMYPGVAQLLDVYNTYYFRPDIPIGVPKRPDPAVDNQDALFPGSIISGPLVGGWVNYLIKKYPHDLRSNEIAFEAVDVYRALLSEAEDHSITVVCSGFLTNLSNLLVSGPDEYSDLNGMELVKKKVNKLVSMAGTFINLDKLGKNEKANTEYNLVMDAKASKHVFEEWPTEIVYLGFDLGKDIWTGAALLQNESIQNNPVKDALHMTSRNFGDSPSWDPAAALIAVRGSEMYFDLVPGRITVDWDGTNNWDYSKKGQYYLKQKATLKSFEKIENDIDELLQFVPDRKKLKDYPRGH